MTYHLPISSCWDAKYVCKTLRLHCVDARVVEGTIRIWLPDEERTTILGRILRILTLRRSRTISLTYDPTKFIQNVALEDAWPRTRVARLCFDDIHSAMLQIGCREGDDREIAAQYCPNDKTLESLFDEIDCLRAQIGELIAAQDFDAAALLRNNEDLIRNRIDDILYASLSK